MKTLGYKQKLNSGVSRAPAIPFIVLAVAVASAGYSTYSSIKQSQQQASMAKYQAKVAQNNATYAEMAAQDAERRGAQQALDQRQKTLQLISTQQTSLAANGVDVAGQSSLGTYQDTFNVGEQDAMTIQQNAGREALGYRQQAGNFNAQAYAADSGNQSPFAAAGGTALGGLGTVADKWYKFDQAGGFSGLFGNSSPDYSGIGTGTDYSRFGGTF